MCAVRIDKTVAEDIETAWRGIKIDRFVCAKYPIVNSVNGDFIKVVGTIGFQLGETGSGDLPVQAHVNQVAIRTDKRRAQ